MSAQPCTAPPGYYCQPLYNRPSICPENWYCPGGAAMARRCPDNRWSAVASIYPEDCKEQMNVTVAVTFVLFFMLVALGLCSWMAAWEWSERKSRGPEYSVLDPYYGEVTKNGETYYAHKVKIVKVTP